MLFFCKYIHIIHRYTQTQYKLTCSCTQMFALCGNWTRDLLRGRRVFPPLRQIGRRTFISLGIQTHMNVRKLLPVMSLFLSFSYLYPTKWSWYIMFSSCDKDSIRRFLRPAACLMSTLRNGVGANDCKMQDSRPNASSEARRIWR
jgi:hypothetical protein